MKHSVYVSWEFKHHSPHIWRSLLGMDSDRISRWGFKTDARIYEATVKSPSTDWLRSSRAISKPVLFRQGLGDGCRLQGVSDYARSRLFDVG